MSAPAPCPSLVPASQTPTLGQRDKTHESGTTRGTENGTPSLRALADNILERNKLGQRVGKRVGQNLKSCPTTTIPVGQENNHLDPCQQRIYNPQKPLVPLFQSGGLGQRDSSGLPAGCPLDGWPFPETGCRFHPKLLARMMAEGTLPLPGGGCPLRRVCRLGRPD
jgi:hypothetical protein